MTNDPKNQKVDFSKVNSIHDNLSNVKYDENNTGDLPLPEVSVFVIKVTLEKPDKACLQKMTSLSFNLHINAIFHNEAMTKARDLVSEFIPNIKFATEIISKNGESVK